MIFEDDTYYARYYIDNDGILVATFHGEPIVVPFDPPIPMCYFADEHRAKAWLHKHQNCHGNG